MSMSNPLNTSLPPPLPKRSKGSAGRAIAITFVILVVIATILSHAGSDNTPKPAPKPAPPPVDLTPSEEHRLALAKWLQTKDSPSDMAFTTSGQSNTTFVMKSPVQSEYDDLMLETLLQLDSKVFDHLRAVGFKTIATTDGNGKRRIWNLATVESDFKKLQAKEDAREDATTGAEIRKQYAKQYEEGMLKKGFSFDVSTSGATAKTLRIKYVLMTKALAYNTGHDPALLITWGELGFNRAEFTDGYDKTWWVTF